MLLYEKKSKTMDISETIVVYDVKIGRCSQLNEYMKRMSTKGQGHSLTSQIQFFFPEIIVVYMMVDAVN